LSIPLIITRVEKRGHGAVSSSIPCTCLATVDHCINNDARFCHQEFFLSLSYALRVEPDICHISSARCRNGATTLSQTNFSGYTTQNIGLVSFIVVCFARRARQHHYLQQGVEPGNPQETLSPGSLRRCASSFVVEQRSNRKDLWTVANGYGLLHTGLEPS